MATLLISSQLNYSVLCYSYICLFEILTHLNTHKYNLLMQQFGTYIKITPVGRRVTHLIVFIQ